MFEGDSSFEEGGALHDDKDFRRLKYVAHRAGDFDDELRRRNGNSSTSDPESERSPSERNHKRPRDSNHLPAFSEFTFTYPSPSTSNGDARTPSAGISATTHEGKGYGIPPADNPFVPSSARFESDESEDEDEREHKSRDKASSLLLGRSNDDSD